MSPPDSQAVRDEPASPDPSTSVPRTARARLAVGLLCLLLAAATAVSYSRLAASRRPAERFARDFSIDLRRPVDAETARLASTSDFAADVLADAALRDIQESVPAGASDPELLRAWRTVEGRRLDEIKAARELLLDALGSRPGSATHRLLLGRLSLAEHQVDRGRILPASEEEWRMPLRAAAVAAPGLDAVWGAMATGLLERWSVISPSERRETPRIVRRAFLDSTAVTRLFSDARKRWGSEAFTFLPDEIGPLSAAAATLEPQAPIPHAHSLLKRLERSARIDRARRLQQIETFHRRGDTDRVRRAAVEFAFHHPAELSDDPVSRRQTARVLEIWPPDAEPAPWESDRRAALIRYFLRGRETDVSARALSRAVDALADVPPYVRAEIQLLNGDLTDSGELAGSRSGAHDPDWTPYFLRLVRVHLRAGRFDEAAALLTRLKQEGADPCDVLAVRRDLALAAGDQAALRILSEEVALSRARTQIQAEPSQATSLFCLSTDEAGKGEIAVTVESTDPSLAAYGWDGARAGLLDLPRQRRLRAPVPREPGSHTFSVVRLYGGDIQVSEARLRR